MYELIMILIFGLYVALVIPHIKAASARTVSLVLLLAWMITTIYLLPPTVLGQGGFIRRSCCSSATS